MPADSDIYYNALLECVEPLLNNGNAGHQKTRPNPTSLFHAFKRRGISLAPFDRIWWEDFILVAIRTDVDAEGKEAQSRLSAAVESITSGDLPAHELIHPYSLALRVGLFEIAYLFRCKARELAIGQLRTADKVNRQSKHDLRSGLPALLEDGRYGEYRDYLEHASNEDGEATKAFRGLNHLYSIINEGNAAGFDWLSRQDTGLDESFRRFVEGKTIAVVGPAKTACKDAEEIDSFDVVVRCNYKEQGIGVDPEIKGMRCDVTYFNSQQARHFLSQTSIRWPPEVSWIVCKSSGMVSPMERKVAESLRSDSASVRGPSSVPHTRSLIRICSSLFNSTLNAIPNVVLDLLRFKPTMIKVFHADLMLTVDRQHGYIPKTWGWDGEMAKVFLRSSSKSHDPVTQYWVLNALWSNGCIHGDSRFDEVMSLGEREYMRRLQQIYGQSGRIVTTN